MKALFVWIGGSIAGVFLLVRSLFVVSVRLRAQHGTVLFELINKKGKMFILQTEWYDSDFPKEMSAICLLEGILMTFRTEERLLRAGYASTDRVVRVTIFRWNFSKLIKVIQKNTILKESEANVFLAQTWEAEKIGTITIPQHVEEPYLVYEKYKDIEEEIKRVLAGKVERTGAILYGSPGNGKTFLVRYFAMRFKLPVYLVSFTPDYNNHDIIRLFVHIKPPAIILLEDFDTYFDGRKCKLKEVKFSFDVILNVLDGIFSASKGVIVCLTAQDIKKVDVALKNRPSRFKFVKHLDIPPYEVRKRILGDESLVQKTDGFSLDKVLMFERDKNLIGGSKSDNSSK